MITEFKIHPANIVAAHKIETAKLNIIYQP